MKLIVDEAYLDIGIETVVFAVIKDVRIVGLNEETETFINAQGHKALSYSDEILNNDVIVGYRDMVKKVGRSIRKFPPTAESLILNINRRKSMMRVNGVVDIYNAHAIGNFLAIGAHDMKKIDGNIRFTFAKEGELFYPIGGGEKKSVDGDFVYKDDKGILAFLDSRDSGLYKIDENTSDILLIVQGNKNTDVSYRVEALNAICEDIVLNFGGKYKVKCVHAGDCEILEN